MAKHISHVKSKVVETTTINGISISKPKLPEAEDLYYGEIAVNYAKGHERLAIKNDDDEIVTFVNENDFIESEKVVASALNDLNTRVTNLSEGINETITELETNLSGDIETLETNLSGQIEELTDIMEESERVTAESLNDLNSRITDFSETVGDAQIEIDRLTEGLNEIDKVTAEALIDLDSRLKDFDGDILSIQRGLNNRYTKSEADAAKCVKVTYDELVGLKTNSQMVPGTYYRITDYVTRTTQPDTQSTLTAFDIIVLALDTNTLSENASAIQHGTSQYDYFANSKLSAWELKYDINNDTTKYAWADTVNGKGVIYYMKDEWGNECPYDFKCIKFKRWAVTNVQDTRLTQTQIDDLTAKLVYDGDNTMFQTRFAYKSSTITIGGGTNLTVNSNDSDFYFTFSATEFDVNNGHSLTPIEDASIKGHEFYESWCYGNVIKPFYKMNATDDDADNINGVQYLNNIVFNGFYSTDNTESSSLPFENYIDYNSNNCTFGSSCNNNVFGASVTNTISGNICSNNTIKNYCYSNLIVASYRNTFGRRSYNNLLISSVDNTFDIGCYNNILLSSSYNTFGKNCINNTLSNSTYNVFGGNNTNNEMSNNCKANVLGNDCSYNSFGTGCVENSLGNLCTSNVFGNNCKYNTLGVKCNITKLGNGCETNVFGNGNDRNTLGARCTDNYFGSGCNDNTFGTDCTANHCGNNLFMSEFTNQCIDNTFGNSCGNIKFTGGMAYANHIGDQCANIQFTHTSSYKNNIVENGNIGIILTTNGTSGQNIQNITIAQGVNSSGTITITHTPQQGQTIYRNPNSQVIDPATT